MTYKIDKTIIVGGGSSGWLTAAALCKYFPNIEITLIESPKIPTIGVGESTTAMMSHFLGYLGINERDFMRGTDAIFKTSVKFNDFYKLNDGGFHYPFGQPDIPKEFGTWQLESWHLVKHFYPELPASDFADSFYATTALCAQNKIDDNIDGSFGSSIRRKFDRGYHFNANLVGPWLKDNWCMPRGVKYIQAEIKNCRVNDDGIEALVLDDGSELSGDFYIDCSGFKSLLLGQALKEDFVDFSHKLPNNRAWAVPTQYKNKYAEMRPYTNSTALTNGWVWHTPIWSRVGNGYAYSDKYTDPEDALEEFKQYFMSDKVPIKFSRKEVDDLPFFEVRMSAGKRKNTFVKNVCAIGLAAGFLEPLEGTGLYFVTETVLFLCKMLSRNAFTQYNIDVYNAEMNRRFLSWVDTLSVFYAYSLRDDSEYWREISKKSFDIDITNPNHFNAEGGFSLYSTNTSIDHGILQSIQNNKSIIANDVIASSTDMMMDITSVTMDRWIFWDELNYEAEAKRFKRIFDDRKKYWKDLSDLAQNNYDYLKERIHNEN